ncbi:GNAT family N-acetyltransferase [Pseudalkalibacillus sp. Hm43]|uniref:GNAT family N-acetyltransferase n=1 Tax=Pseudalkalibacillus sp. Hm43 TaxID=3450742 RepID=UPI003F420B30
MYTIRAEQPSDVEKIREVNDSAFEQENEGKLIAKLRESEAFVEELSLVAETEQQEIIGHILFSRIRIETESGMVDSHSLALAPMAVKPESQNKGIGSALVREGLKRAEEIGYESVVVLGHPTYYPKFGFIPASEKGIKPPFDVSDEVFMVLELDPGALDEVEGTVRYPDAFLEV